jgi:Lon protease-like protein
MLPVLQGAFLITVRGKTTHEWCDLETQDEPYVEDHIPFFAPDEQSDALQAVCDELADEERADV